MSNNPASFLTDAEQHLLKETHEELYGVRKVRNPKGENTNPGSSSLVQTVRLTMDCGE